MTTNKKEFQTALLKAMERRKTLVPDFSSYRLLNGKHENTPGFFIDCYENHFFIRTENKDCDRLIGTAGEILKDHFDAKSIWIKNYTKIRQQKNLEQQDACLFGEAVSEIRIHEGDFSYLYDTKSENFFPLQERILRNHFNRSLSEKSQVLNVGFEPWQIFSQEKSHLPNQFISIPTHGRQISEVTARVREQAHHKKWNTMVINCCFIRNIEKNKKALFHFFYNILKNAEANSQLFLQHPPKQNFSDILQATAKKLDYDIFLLNSNECQPDFPQKLGVKSHSQKVCIFILSSFLS